MIKKDEIIKKYKDLILILKEHNKNYYVDDPKITDGEFDLLKKKLKN